MRNKSAKSEEYITLYDRYLRIYEDPVKVMFEIMAGTKDHGLRLQAAKELTSYRYPKRKAMDITAGGVGDGHITFIMGPASIEQKTLVITAQDEFSRLPLGRGTLIEQRIEEEAEYVQ